MTPLRQRMLNDMTVRGLAENTKKSYLSSVTGLARHYRRSPDSVSAQEVQDYIIHLHERRGLTQGEFILAEKFCRNNGLGPILDFSAGMR